MYQKISEEEYQQKSKTNGLDDAKIRGDKLLLRFASSEKWFEFNGRWMPCVVDKLNKEI